MSGTQPRTVQFRHPFFLAHAEGVFRRGESDGEPVFAVALGEQRVVFDLASLKREFVNAEYAEDGKMLDRVALGLRYVRSLAIGDGLPDELLTGEASWQPSEKSRATAEKRIVAGLVKWSENLDVRLSEPEDLRWFIDTHVDPELIARSIARLADKIFPDDENGVERVESLIGDLTTEYTYLETIKGMLAPVEQFGDTLAAIRRAHDTGNGNSEVDAVIRLHTIALKMFRAQIAAVNASVEDIFLAMTEFSRCQRRLRKLRDNLYASLTAWHEVLEPWHSVSADASNMGEVMPLVTDIYRFLAPRYMPVDEWTLAGAKNSEGASRRMRYGRGAEPCLVDAA